MLNNLLEIRKHIHNVFAWPKILMSIKYTAIRENIIFKFEVKKIR